MIDAHVAFHTARSSKRLIRWLFVALTACNGSSSDQELRAAAERYLRAELAGAGTSDSVDALFEDCIRAGSDRIEVVTSTEEQFVRLDRDTAALVVRYAVVGYAFSWDEATRGPRNWAFTANPETVTDTVFVLSRARQPARLLCGSNPGTRTHIASLGWLPPRLDDSSRISWERTRPIR